MVCAGYDLESSQRAIELAERYPEIWATVGIHPDEIQNSNDKFTNQPLREQIQIISKLTKHQKVVAVGEAGLDFRADTTLEEKQRQIELFRFNIALAVEARLPIVVHCRNAFDDAFRVLSTKCEVLKLVRNLIEEACMKLREMGMVGRTFCLNMDGFWARKTVNSPTDDPLIIF
ncbi:MAG: Hydrolase, TatD family, partial [Candidatus Amesbacteria bacterium GW2011_GWA1_48_9]